MLTILLIFPLMIIIVFRLNLNEKIAGQTSAGGTKDVKIMVPFKYLSNFLENSWNAINWLWN